MSRKITGYLVILCLFLYTSNASARKPPPGPWTLNSTLSAASVKYEESSIRDRLESSGFMLSADYHDKSSFKLGYQQTDIRFLASSGLTDIIEKSIILGGIYHSYSDDGRTSTQINLYQREDESDFIDEIDIANIILSYTNNSRKFYLDIGYTESSYQADNQTIEDMDVSQYSPTIGFSLNDNFDWLQLKGFLINPSQSNRVSSDEKTSAIELKWKHWFEANVILIDNMILTVLNGERIFSVDSETNTIYNLGDKQTGSVSLSMQWKLGTSTELLLSTGRSDFNALLNNEDYTSKFFNMNISTSW